MQPIITFARRHPLPLYYVATFVISWGGILVVVGGLSGIPGTPEQFLPLLPPLLLAMLLGPAIAGVLMTALVDGSTGLRGLLSSLTRWRADIRWWLIALLTAPLVMTLVPGVVSLFAAQYTPGIFVIADKGSLIGMGIGAGLSTLLEEIGWTGFAIPKIRQRHNVFSTGLIVGVLWAAWHLLVNFWSSGTASGSLSPSHLLTSLFFSWGILTAFRVLMVWVHGNAPSILVAWIMHATLTSGNVILGPLAPAAATGPVWSLTIAAALWIIVAMLVGAGALKAKESS